jgi:hypothetical protein
VDVSFKRNGKRHVLRFPALVQRRRRLFGACHQSPALIGLGATPAWQISNIRIFTSADERAIWRNAASIALRLHGRN